MNHLIWFRCARCHHGELHPPDTPLPFYCWLCERSIREEQRRRGTEQTEEEQ